MAEVSQFASDSLQSLITRAGGIPKALSNSLLQHMLDLPRVMRSNSQSQKLLSLRLICGFLPLLSSSTTTTATIYMTMTTPACSIPPNALGVLFLTSFQQISFALFSALKISLADVRVLERGADDFTTSYYESRFVYADGETSGWLLRMCLSLGQYLSPNELAYAIDQLLEILRDPQTRRMHKELLLLLNQMILGAGQQAHIARFISDSLPEIVAEYLSKDRWCLPSAPQDFELEGEEVLPAYVSPALLDNGILVGLLIRGLANVAQIMGAKFRPHLMKSLYPLLEKLGDFNPTVSQAALASLHRIARFCEYESLSVLVVDNADYLIDTVTTQLRNINVKAYSNDSPVPGRVLQSPVPRFLQSLLQQTGAGKAMIPLLDDTIKMLLNKLGQQQVYVSPYINTKAYLQILHSVVVAINSLTSHNLHLDTTPSNVLFPLVSDDSAFAPPLTDSAPATSTEALANKRNRGGFFSATKVGDRLRSFLSQAKEAQVRQANQDEEFEEFRRQSNEQPGKFAQSWFEERQREKAQQVEEMGVDEVAEEEAKNAPGGGDIEEKLTPEEQMVSDILDTSRHFISSGHVLSAVCAMSIVQEVSSIVNRGVLYVVCMLGCYGSALSTHFPIAARRENMGAFAAKICFASTSTDRAVEWHFLSIFLALAPIPPIAPFL